MDGRWTEIKTIWRESPPLWFVTGVGAGLVIGFILGMNARQPLDGWFVDGFWAEALGITLTVGLLDTLSRYRDREQQKERLIRQADSKANAIAIDAIDELRAEGWLTGENGLLKKRDMKHARLMNARLKEANLEGSDLFRANFIHAHMTSANLRNTQLNEAIFCHARMIGVDFTGANVAGANFTATTFDQDVTLPDGTPYDQALGLEQWGRFGAIIDEDVPL